MITAASNIPVGSAAPAAQPDIFTQTSNDTLGRDAFLRLLITQIEMQDPLEPMSGRDYIAQLSQLSAVEQLQTANLQLTILQHAQGVSQALLLIGHHIATADDDITGLVEAVVFSDGQAKLIVGDHEVDPSDVVKVW